METQLSNKWKRKEKVAFAASLAAILVLSVVVGALSMHNLYLSERLGISDGEEDLYEGLNFEGFITVTKIDAEGNRIIMVQKHNLITNIGKLFVCDMLGNYSTVSGSDNNSQYLAIGTGSGGGVGDTTLQTEAFRAAATYAEPVAYNYTISYTWPAGTFSGEAITEAGTFTTNTGGGDNDIMLNYQDFTAITLQTGDSLQVTFEFQIS